MFHTIYKITNLINGNIYIGKHSTKCLDDAYMGSGIYIKNAISKHGVENFTKEILYIFDNENDAYKKEREVVNEDFVSRKDVYNLIIGGDSFESINSNINLRKEKNRRAALSMNKINWSDPEFIKRNKDRMVAQNKELHAKGILKRVDWTGKKHKQESKDKIGEKNSIHQKGEGNSQYGTCWVYKEDIGNKKIKKEDIEIFTKNGWKKGRRINKKYNDRKNRKR